MTRETVENLDVKYRIFLENRKAVLARTQKKDDVIGEIRGYLKGLRDCSVISEVQFRVLLTYYTMRPEES